MREIVANTEETAPSVLVVEDDPALLELLAEELQDAGFTPTLCTRGQPALATLAAQGFDLLLLDQRLPDLPGIALCQAARAWYGDVPVVILLMADEHVSQWITALELGADDCVGKPFDIEELRARIEAKGRRRAAWRVQYGR
jgi:DNA-binding response OmpR family regulator